MGNVPQLTVRHFKSWTKYYWVVYLFSLQVDLLVETLNLRCLGHLLQSSLLPCVGPTAYSGAGAGLSTAAQLFGRPGVGFVVLQQRAPAVLGCQHIFAESLAAWISQQHFAHVCSPLLVYDSCHLATGVMPHCKLHCTASSPVANYACHN